MEISHLKKDRFYIFDHAGKDRLILAKFIGVHEELGDTTDPEMIKVAVYTGPGSGQENLANSMVYAGNRKLPPLWTDKLFRPSQIRSINAPPTAKQDALQKEVKEAEDQYTPTYDQSTYAYTPSSVIPVAQRIQESPATVKGRDYSKFIIGGIAALAGAGAATTALLVVGG